MWNAETMAETRNRLPHHPLCDTDEPYIPQETGT
jgi:hypothetical protein